METTYPSPVEPCSTKKDQPSPTRIPAKSWLRRGTRLAALAISSALLATTMTSRAQQIYLDTFTNLNDATNWAVLYGYTMTDPLAHVVSNNLVVVGYTYTNLGIPIAPHSAQFGSASIPGGPRGLKMSSCYTNPVTELSGHLVTGLSACPTNFSVSQNFVMHADMWINVDCDPYPVVDTNYLVDGNGVASVADGDSANSTASTVLYGAGYGTAGTKATIPGDSDAIFCATLTDNGTTAMARMYSSSQTGSYQDGVYQTSGTTIPSFPGDPFVYNIGNGLTGTGNGLGGRNLIGSAGNPPYTRSELSSNLATGQLWCNIFPPTQVPVAEEILYPQQTNNLSMPGIPTFGWHDLSVQKVGNVIIYEIDGNILATGNYASAGTPAGYFLTFVASRTGTGVASATSATAKYYTNLNYVIFANLVVSNYDNVVNVTAPQSTATAQEGQAGSQAYFDINRPNSGVPLTVTYTLTGTATNGVQYQTTPTTVTFASTATDTNVYITPIDDGIPNPTTTVVLTLQSGAGYVGAGSAVVDILDGDTPTVDISSPTGAQAYGRYDNATGPGNNADYIPYLLTRRGKLTTGADLNVNLTYSGDAVSGTDFTPVSSVTIPDGASTNSLSVVPVYNPNVSSNRTVTVSVTSGSGYAIGNGPASGTVVSANYAVTSPVLLSDPLTDPNDANWNVVYGCGDPLDDATDFTADFGISLSSGGGGISIPTPPNGNNNALFLTCNKAGAPSSPGAINAYYTNVFLSGNYAVRFNMNIVEGDVTASDSEGPVFGINHTGTCSNWWYGTGFITNQTWSSDGVWYYINAQPSGAGRGDYQEYTGLGGTVSGVVTNQGWTNLADLFQSTFAQDYKDSSVGGPFTALDVSGNQTPGVPANASPSIGYDASTWSDVEIKQQNGVVTMSINHTPIFVYTNTSAWTGGYLMLGYEDPFGASVGTSDAGVYYANLQVVQLPTPSVMTINSIVISGGNVVIKFTTSSATDTISSFTLQSSGTVNGTYNAVSPAANITSLGSNQFQATTPYTGGIQFYRIQHN